MKHTYKIVIITLTILLSSCTLTVSPDGTRSATIDGPSLVHIIASK